MVHDKSSIVAMARSVAMDQEVEAVVLVSGKSTAIIMPEESAVIPSAVVRDYSKVLVVANKSVAIDLKVKAAV